MEEHNSKANRVFWYFVGVLLGVIVCLFMAVVDPVFADSVVVDSGSLSPVLDVGVIYSCTIEAILDVPAIAKVSSFTEGGNLVVYDSKDVWIFDDYTDFSILCRADNDQLCKFLLISDAEFSGHDVLECHPLTMSLQTLCECGSQYADRKVMVNLSLTNEGGRNVFYFGSDLDQLTFNLYGDVTDKKISLAGTADNLGNLYVETSMDFGSDYILEFVNCTDLKDAENNTQYLIGVVLGGICLLIVFKIVAG
jgi:hypothetical protein